MVAVPGDGHWDRQFAMAGTGSRNFSLRFNSNLLYTAGFNLKAGQVDTNALINVFDGTNWSILGQVNGGTTIVEDYAFVGKKLYVGGVFLGVEGVSAIGLAQWDGSAWSDVGGFKGGVFRLATDGTNLYVGGTFTNVGGIFNTNLARWNGTSWSAIGGGVGYYDSLNSGVNAIVWRNGQLYIGGAFTNAGSTAATNLARWDGASWSQIGGGVGKAGDTVTAMEFLGNDLYVGGAFTNAGGVLASNVAKWNGTTWSALGAGLKAPSGNTPVNALAFLGSDLYATGNFTNAGGITATRVAKWDGSTWYSLGGINDWGIRAVSNSGSVYICGYFNMASNSVIGDHIIRYDGTSWHGVTGKPAQGTQSFVFGLGLGADGLYTGGIFLAAGDIAASRIARWDGTNWNALGSGVTDSYGGNTIAARVIKARNNEVYVGGSFLDAGGVTANNIALWDGSGWSSLGYGVDGSVLAIEADAFEVYVGGSFTNACDYPGGCYIMNRIATWDPFNGWYPLGSGVLGSGNVAALCLANGLLYAGGSFTNVNGTTANRIAAWDGFSWYSLGSGSANGLNGSVNAILADGTDIYVGGSFTTAGGATARAIAKWDGSTWSPLGQGMFSTGTAAVNALAKIGAYLYAGGNFTNAGGSVVTRPIARWDGSQWQAMGSGVGNDQTSPRVNALAAWGDDLYVAGIFETAGLADSGYIARWNDQIDFTPPPVMRLSNPRMLPGNAFKFRVATATPATYVIDYSADLQTWTPLVTNSVISTDVTNIVTGIKQRTYRMRAIP